VGAGCLNENPGQVVLDTRQVPAEPGPQGGLDSLGELLQGQPPGEKMLTKRGDGLLTIRV
jgi:hypothetical protein